VLGVIGPTIVLVAAFTGVEKLLYAGLAGMVAVAVWDFVSPANRRCGPDGCEVQAGQS
jgi:mercuric ion transport protein